MKHILFLLLGLIALATAASAQTRSRNLPTVTLTVAEGTVTEGGAGRAALVVRRSHGTENALRVFYRVAGDARNSLDYERLEGSVLIPAGSHEATIEIIPLDDEVFERVERVALQLKPAPRNSPKYRIGTARAQAIRILDNDPPETGPLPRIWLGLHNPRPGSGPVPLYVAPAQVTILVTDSAPYTVDTLEIFANDESLVVLENPNPGRRYVNPRNARDIARFKFRWSNVPAGTYTITARGVTTDGRNVFADPITVTVHP